jgi:hypothetical protein
MNQFNPPQHLPGLTNFARVSDDLYRGAEPTQEGLAYLATIGVKTVLSLCEFYDLDWFDPGHVRSLGMGYVSRPCNPWHPELEDVSWFLRILTTTLLPVYIHCRQGCDRTGLLIACYRISVQGWPKKDAIAELRAFGYHESTYPQILKFIEEYQP